MRPRRSTRGQKKPEVEAPSCKPDFKSGTQGSLSTSKKCDEVDGLAPAEAEKKATQTTTKECPDKKTSFKKQQKVLGTKKQRSEQKDKKHSDINIVVKKSGIDAVKKRQSVGKNVHVTEHKNAKQKHSHCHFSDRNVDEMKTCKDNSKLESCHSKSDQKEKDEKGTVQPTDVKQTYTSATVHDDPATSNPTACKKSLKDVSDRMTNSTIFASEDSGSSDSDFEEVSSQYRTPESSFMSSTYSDSGICRRLEDSFSDYTAASSQDMSVSMSVSDLTDCSSVSTSAHKTDTYTKKSGGKTEGKADSIPVKRPASTASTTNKTTSSKSAKQSSSTTSTGSKTISKKNAAKNQSRKATPDNQGKKPNKKNKTDGASAGTVAESDDNNIMAILMKMEGQPPKSEPSLTAEKPSTSGQSAGRKRKPKKPVPKNRVTGDSTEESDWEEVEDYKQSPVKSQIPDAPVEITINDPTMMRKKRKKKEFDWRAYVQRKIKRMAREIQIEMHKVHLLCLLSHGMQQNAACSDVTVCATALSVVPPSRLQKDVAFYDDETLVYLLKWFRATFCLSASGGAKSSCSLVTAAQLVKVIQDGSASESRLLVMVLAAILRAMGFNVRLVISLQPLPLKPSSADLGKAASKRKKPDKSDTNSASSKKPKQDPDPQKSTLGGGGNPKSKSTKPVSGTTQKLAKTGGGAKHKSSDPKASASASKKKKAARPASASASARKRKPAAKRSADSSSDEDEDEDGPSVAKRRASERIGKVVKPSTSAKDADIVSEEEEEEEEEEKVSESDLSDGSNFSEEEEEAALRKTKAKGRGKGRKKQKDVAGLDEESDREFDKSFQTKSLLVKEGRSRKKANRKIVSEESSTEEVVTESKGRDYWLEVYLPRQSKWVCVDCIRCVVGRPYDASAAASQPVLYVLSFQNEGSVKDITAKYAPQWLSHTRKQRVDSDWWRESLESFASANTALDDQENRDIKDHLVQRPLPTNIGEYKNHPLYALRRHLLKFEAIYPENSIPMGYIRHEPVYARECVHTLHSRDNWLKEARLVRLGETPYKMVKSRKRWNRAKDSCEELDLELFGRWQTEDYIPPPAVNGKVPKNEYGNVELFQPSMLPGGTVHVRVPALNRVARKLGIDIAAAMTGWDHHCGYSHPVLDGWVVCEEHKDVLLAAWEEDQEIQRQREEERREKRVLNNWTTLVRGLLIKEKLKKKFNLEEKAPPPAAEAKKKKAAKTKTGEKATDLQHAWPARQQRQLKEQREKPAPVPSHFTVETM
ncbi:DNA repair protein complementing XP-C cells homolog [Babylonia areolata]|uniref:DNA repair protein complementing XP-C cells homolog n=1 Tax=Babylonia areolata TaxID=304850 RepID=UPI003FD181F5